MLKKLVPLAALIFVISAAAAQDSSTRFVRKGLFRSQATLSSGAMLGPQVTNIYLHGGFDYYVDESVSIRNDGYYFITTLADSKVFKMNHSIFSGGSYHFKTKGNLDPYFGIQPGVAIAQVQYDVCPDNMLCFIGSTSSKPAASPLISGVAGFNYYAQRFFHLFLETRYIQGKHLSDYGPTSLNELRFSFGLGWNINLKKAQ
jgi:hypothetical protein